MLAEHAVWHMNSHAPRMLRPCGGVQNAMKVTADAIKATVGSDAFWLRLSDKRRVLGNGQGWRDAVLQLVHGVAVKVRTRWHAGSSHAAPHPRGSQLRQTQASAEILCFALALVRAQVSQAW